MTHGATPPFRAFLKVLNPSPIPYENNIPRPFRAGLLIYLNLKLSLNSSDGNAFHEEALEADENYGYRQDNKGGSGHQ